MFHIPLLYAHLNMLFRSYDEFHSELPRSLNLSAFNLGQRHTGH